MSTLALDNEAVLVSTEDLAEMLHSFLSPAQSEQPFPPHDSQVREIAKALDTRGTTIFLYGDRAPRNTLAQTLAAYGFRGDEPAPTECGASRTFRLKPERHRNGAREEESVLVIDEFDEIRSEAERSHFADFITQIEDRRLPIRFVLCGVSESVKTLLGADESCYSTADFARPRPDANVGKIKTTQQGASHALPHYAHLVSERLFWEMFNDPTFARSLI